MSSLVGIHTSVYANSVAIQGIGGGIVGGVPATALIDETTSDPLIDETTLDYLIEE